MPPRQVQGSATPIGVANIADAPGGYRRFFRLSQLSAGVAGEGRKIEDIWATFLQELDDMGVPEATRSRLESLGPRKVFGPKGLGKSVTLGLDKKNFRVVRETLAVAKGATRGHKPAFIREEWSRLLKSFASDERFAGPEGARLLEELRKVDPPVVAKGGGNQAMSALVRRGEDPFVVRMFNKTFRRPNSPILPEGIEATLKAANAGKLPAVSAAASKALTAGGLSLGGVGRKIAGIAGKGALGPASVAIGLGFEAKRAANILGRPARARQQALQGLAGQGPTSSADFLRSMVGQQEAIARRQVVMQKFEPDLWQEVVRVLSDTGGTPGTLTSTERRIGSDEQIGIARRGRSSEDMKVLLDELFNQMGG